MLLTTDAEFNKTWLKKTKLNESSRWRSEDVRKVCMCEFILPDPTPATGHTVCLTLPPPSPSSIFGKPPLRLQNGFRNFTHSFGHSCNKHGLRTLTHTDDAAVRTWAVLALMEFPV